MSRKTITTIVGMTALAVLGGISATAEATDCVSQAQYNTLLGIVQDIQAYMHNAGDQNAFKWMHTSEYGIVNLHKKANNIQYNVEGLMLGPPQGGWLSDTLTTIKDNTDGVESTLLSISADINDIPDRTWMTTNLKTPIDSIKTTVENINTTVPTTPTTPGSITVAAYRIINDEVKIKFSAPPTLLDATKVKLGATASNLNSDMTGKTTSISGNIFTFDGVTEIAANNVLYIQIEAGAFQNVAATTACSLKGSTGYACTTFQ